MPDFGDVGGMVTPTPLDAARTQNILMMTPAQLQALQTANAGAGQDLADRATLRGLADPLASRDAGAIAGAAVLPAGAVSVNALSNFDQQKAARELELYKLGLTLPRDGPVVPGDAGAGAGGGAAGGPATVDQLNSMLWGQESGGAANSRTSIDGARGGHQIMPGTFAQYALPGESIDNPDHNAAVGKRIVTDLSNRFGGDPARVAVGYFSGPDNVAPPGSPTPWKVDAKDGNGKSTSSYVSDALARLRGMSAGSDSSAASAASSSHDHAISVVGGLSQAILNAPADQRPALWQQYQPIMVQAGAVRAPAGYPGDAAAAGLARVASDPALRAQRIAQLDALPPHQPGGAPSPDGPAAVAAPPQPGFAPVAAVPGAPGVAGLNDLPSGGKTPPPSVQVAGPGALPAGVPPAGPDDGPPINALATPPGSAAPAPAAVASPAAPPPVLAQEGSAGPPRNQLMPAASAAPPPSAPARSPYDPPPGAIKRVDGYGKPFGSPPAGMAYYRVPGDPNMQLFRDPTVPQPLKQFVAPGIVGHADPFGNEVGPRISVPSTARDTVVPAEGGGKHIMQGPDIVRTVGPDLRESAIKAMERDDPEVRAINADAQASQTGLLRYNEMARIIPLLKTGPTGDVRGAAAARLEELGVAPATIKRWTGMESGTLFQELAKLAQATVGQSAKNDLGSNVGVQSLELYAKANPGTLMLDDANKRMTNFGRVISQFSLDYAAGANNHYNPQANDLLNPGPTTKPSYRPLSNYKEEWQARNNPQIGAATTNTHRGDAF